MDDTASNRPACRHRARVHLQSASGAFDLPSILIGVAVVAILAIGVLAAVFRVIPWTQDNAAKQDLAAVYTAQGTAYAKDAQEYKDLNGLEDAGLISDMDPAKAAITVSGDGKGYQAVVTSNTGTKWFITHDSPTPREWEDKAASQYWLNTPAWASDSCTPAIVDTVMIHSAYSHPGVIEMVKRDVGLPYDKAAYDEFWAVITLPMPDPTDQEQKVLDDLISREPSLFELQDKFFEALPSFPMEAADGAVETVATARSQYAAGVDAWMISFCHA